MYVDLKLQDHYPDFGKTVLWFLYNFDYFFFPKEVDYNSDMERVWWSCLERIKWIKGYL